MESSITGIFKNTKLQVFLILLSALFVRLIGIASRPIWYDEAFAVLFSEKGLGQMLYGTLAPTGTGSADIHPLGYYTLLWSWMKVFGESLVAVRLLSILAGVVSVGLVYLIAIELFDSKTAKTSALLVALAPFQIHYSQEIRMYAFLALWLLLATYAYLRGSASGNWRWWTLFGIAVALAQYTHNLAAFFLIPLVITPILKRDWKTVRSVFLSGCLAILIYLPWLIQLPAQLAKIDQAYWVTKPGIDRLFTLLLVFTTNTPLPNGWVMPALILAILTVVIALMQTIRTKKGNTLKANGLWALYLSFAPPILLFIFSQWKPVYIERALLPSGVFFCIWLAWTIHHTGLPKAGRGFMLAMIAITFTMGIYQHVTYRGFPYGPFDEINAHLKQQMQPGDLILHSNKLSMLPAMYFDRDLPQTFIADPPGSGTDTFAPATQEVLHIEAEPDIKSAVSRAGRVWYIIYQQSIDEFIQAGKATHPDIEFLDSEFRLQTHETWDDVQILLFVR